MGSTNYSSATYQARMDTNRQTGRSFFTHDSDVKSGKVDAKVHEKLDVRVPNKEGKRIRESRDSDVHPDSRAVSVIFDVTASNGRTPKIFTEKLDKLMAMLVQKGYLTHPHVMFGAIGDAYCDRIPLQIGQFEAGNEIDETLSLIALEGGGGGQMKETYELAMYYLARHATMDCLEKRGEKGYLFLLGDELCYPEVDRGQVKEHIGDDLEANIPTEKILEELREKFEVFRVMPGETCYWKNEDVTGPLGEMFGERFIELEKPEDVCELICSTIGLCEGYNINEIATDLTDLGSDKDSVARSSKALAKVSDSLAKKGSAAVVAGGGGLPDAGGGEEVDRL